MDNLKISARQAILSGVLLLIVLVVGLVVWGSLSASRTRNLAATHKAILFEESVDVARSAQIEFEKQVQEWKDILLRGNDPIAFEKYRDAFTKHGEATEKNLQQLKVLLHELGLDTGQVDQASRAHQELNAKYLAALKQYDFANPNSAHILDVMMKGMDRLPNKLMGDIVVSIIAQSNQMRL
jgi:methyl-accepting chemotaxis protein-1 (serine sensor receptor)